MSQSEDLLDLGHLRSWIGREETALDTLTGGLVERYRATLDMPEQSTRDGDVAPRLIHFCLAPAASVTAGLGADGHPARGGFLPPVPLERRMWAAGRVTFSGDLRIGDKVRRTSRIADVATKSGSSGLLCFVTVDHLVEVNGGAIVSETQTLVYRGGGARDETSAMPAQQGAHRQVIQPSAPLLFRYSALTFNGHRIHYDRSYATDVEAYPGLIVHGPLQATLLYNYADKLRGRPPSRFRFRSLSPLFDDRPFVLNAGAESAGTLKLWTARERGPTATSAEADWE